MCSCDTLLTDGLSCGDIFKIFSRIVSSGACLCFMASSEFAHERPNWGPHGLHILNDKVEVGRITFIGYEYCQL